MRKTPTYQICHFQFPFEWLFVLHQHIISIKTLKKMVNYQTLFNSYLATGLFLYPLKTSGFLMFSGGIEKDQWHEIC